MAVDAVHAAVFQAARGDELHQLAGKQNIDIGRQDEFAFRAANTGVLGNHLVERQSLVVAIAAVPFGWNRQHAEAARTGVRPAQGLGQRRVLGRRIPVDQHQLHRKTVAPGLLSQRVHEDLDAAKQVGSMIVVSGSGDNGEIGPLGRHGLAQATL